MLKFYEKLRTNKKINKTEALRQAKIEMINEKKFASPYYWAPFILIGR
jgi:CHAT domain-containing protein